MVYELKDQQTGRLIATLSYGDVDKDVVECGYLNCIKFRRTVNHTSVMMDAYDITMLIKENPELCSDLVYRVLFLCYKSKQLKIEFTGENMSEKLYAELTFGIAKVMIALINEFFEEAYKTKSRSNEYRLNEIQLMDDLVEIVRRRVSGKLLSFETCLEMKV